MTKKENLKNYIKGKNFSYIPVSGESFMDFSVADSVFKQKGIEKKSNMEDLVVSAQILGNSNVPIGMDQFGNREEKISEWETILTYDTGAVWKVVTCPNYFRDMLKAPLPADNIDFDVLFPTHGPVCDLDVKKEGIDYLHEKGYFVEANSFGIWFSIYTLFMQFDEALVSLVSDQGLIRELVDRTEEVLLKTIEDFLKIGADGVIWPDDAGSNQNTLFSPIIYKEFFMPTHRKIADICHKYGAIARMHSHGNIERIMDCIVDAGIDIIHPVGPGDNNDLSLFKKKWGDRICINGGLSKNIGLMSCEQIKEHIDSVLQVGLPGGRFVPCLESGIPRMPLDKMEYFVKYREEALDRFKYLV